MGRNDGIVQLVPTSSKFVDSREQKVVFDALSRHKHPQFGRNGGLPILTSKLQQNFDTPVKQSNRRSVAYLKIRLCHPPVAFGQGKCIKWLFTLLTLTMRFLLRLPGELAIALVRAYQKIVSPFFPPVCRFTPSCSEYCILAIRRYGLIVGIAKGIWRIFRCNPWNSGGKDEV